MLRRLSEIGLRCALHVALAMTLIAAPAQADNIDDLEVGQRHVLQLGGRRLVYESLVGREPIRVAGTDQVRARMFYVAFRMPVRPGDARPLTVIWNGGPGGAIGAMLLGGQVPKRVEGTRIVDNADTLLDSTDLLYLDAVGSGFSRPESTEDRSLFYQTRGDVDAFVECMLAWRRRHGAESQTVFLSGVSWGAYRVAAVADALSARGVPVGGGAMMAGRNGLAKPDVEFRFRPLDIVQYPRIAQFHGRLAKEAGSDIVAVERQAQAWATGTYLPALARLDTLTPNERDAIARRLALYSGLPLPRINRQTLVVTRRDMVDGLLADQGDTLLQYDMRLVMPRSPLAPQPRASVARYIRDTLGYTSGLAYYGLVWDAKRVEGFMPTGFDIPDWNYLDGFYADQASREEHARLNALDEAGGYPPRGQELPVAAAAMRRVPSMRMLAIHGRYDGLPASCPATEAQLAEIGADIRSQVTFLCVNSGHPLFVEDALVRSVVNAAMRDMLHSAASDTLAMSAGLETRHPRTHRR